MSEPSGLFRVLQRQRALILTLSMAAVFAGLLDLVVQLLLVLLGLVFVFRPEVIQQSVHFGTAPSLSQVIMACALAMVAYTGVEAIGDMAAEARDPDGHVGRRPIACRRARSGSPASRPPTRSRRPR